MPSGSAYPFTLGVASGMPRPDSIVLWTRLAPRPHESGGGLRIARASSTASSPATLYESSNPRLRLRPHEGPAPLTLAAYRARHATYKLDADLRAAHAAHPWLVTWDDHEVENDYANDQSPSNLGAEAFLRRRAAAYKAYFEHMPVAPAMLPSGPAMRIHDRFVWGRLAELWTVDNRQYRDVQACPDSRGAGSRLLTGCDSLKDPARSMLGSAQERWLVDGIAASRRRWQVIAQGTQISEAGVDTANGRRINSDGWDGYPVARERLLRGIAESGRSGVLCLGGDVHRHVAANLRLRSNDADSPLVASEIVCSSLTSHGVSEAVMAQIRASNPDLVHGRSDERGYVLLEITPEATRCDFLGTPSPVAADARLQSQGLFVIERARPGVQALG